MRPPYGCDRLTGNAVHVIRRTSRGTWAYIRSVMDSRSSSSADPEDSRRFERWLQKAALVTGLGLTTEERQGRDEEQKHLRCEKWKAELMNYSASLSRYFRAWGAFTLITRARLPVHFLRPRPFSRVHA